MRKDLLNSDFYTSMAISKHKKWKINKNSTKKLMQQNRTKSTYASEKKREAITPK